METTSSGPEGSAFTEGLGGSPDINPKLSRAEWDRQCEHYFDCAYYCPPDAFLFHHYDESGLLKCERGIVGGNYTGDTYFVHGHDTPGYYGAYNTRDIAYYLKSGTWVEVPSAVYFATRKVDEIRAALADAEIALSAAKAAEPTGKETE